MSSASSSVCSSFILFLSLQALGHLLRDQQSFLYRDHVGWEPRIISCDPTLAIDRLFVEQRVERKPKPGEILQNARTHKRCIFANTAAENDRLTASESRQISADIVAYPVAKNLQRQTRAFIRVEQAHQFASIVRFA